MHREMAARTEKACSKCGVVKPVSDFTPVQNAAGVAKYQPKCRPCSAKATAEYREANREKALAAVRAWRLANPERVKAYNGTWRKRNPERARAHELRRYGLTPEDHAKMVSKQRGRCAICKAEKELQIDHDHSTGLVRGLLCRSCNTALGKMKDSAVILRSAIAYLNRRRPKASS